MSTPKRLPAWIDAEMPFRGPCAFCGHPDARHREVDAMMDAITAGDTPESVAADYERPIQFVQELMNEYPCRPKRGKRSE